MCYFKLADVIEFIDNNSIIDSCSICLSGDTALAQVAVKTFSEDTGK